jgi:hypothetical protein
MESGVQRNLQNSNVNNFMKTIFINSSYLSAAIVNAANPYAIRVLQIMAIYIVFLLGHYSLHVKI